MVHYNPGSAEQQQKDPDNKGRPFVVFSKFLQRERGFTLITFFIADYFFIIVRTILNFSVALTA